MSVAMPQVVPHAPQVKSAPQVSENSELSRKAVEQEAIALDPEDLSCKVDALLKMPFLKALVALPELRQHIDDQEDVAAVTEEFRSVWHPEAPAELRQVLEELIDPVAAAASTAATEAFLKNPTTALVDADADEKHDFLNDRDFENDYEKSEMLQDGGRSGEHLSPEALGGSYEASEEDAEAEDHIDLKRAVDMLLRRDFGEALEDLPALRRHIASQEDAKEVEEEFRQSWHPEAPEALRQVLEELLDPESAAANAKETTAFMERMAGMSGVAGPAGAPPGMPMSKL